MPTIKLHCSVLAVLLLTGCAAPSPNSTTPAKPVVRKAVQALPKPPVPPGLKIQRASTARVSTTSVGAPVPGSLLSVKGFGGGVPDRGEAVAVDKAGNVFFGGQLNYRPLIAKRTAAGQVAWLKEAAGQGGGTVTGVAVDGNGDVFVTGNFTGTVDFGGGLLTSAGGFDIFVAKLSPAGAHLWSKRFGGTPYNDVPSDTGDGIAVDTNDNSVVVAGHFDSTVDFGGGAMTTLSPGGPAGFLVKFRSDGRWVWNRRVSGDWGAALNAVAVDAHGNILLTGFFYATVDFGGGPVTVSGRADMFVAKYSPANTLLWLKHFGNSDPYLTTCRGTAITVDRLGDVVVTGVSPSANISFGGQVLTNLGMDDIVLAKYSGTDGQHKWSKIFGGSQPDLGNAVAVAPNGAITLTGSIRKLGVDFGGGLLPVVAGNSAFVANFTTEGIHRWSKAFGAGNEEGWAVVTTADGRSFVVGRFGNTVDFGGTSLTGVGASDVFLAEFAGEPAASTPPEARPVEIIDIGESYAVIGIQTNSPGGNMQFKRADTVTGPWTFIADPGWLAQGETAMVMIPKNWLPHNRMFVNVILSASPRPMTPAGAVVPSGKTVTVKGVRYNLVSAGGTAQFPVYRLQKP